MSFKKIRIASFDIGKKNFAQYIEDVDMEIIEELNKKYNSLPPKFKRRVKGPTNPHIDRILEEVYTSSNRVQTGVYDLREDKESNKFDMGTRKNLLRHLESYDYLWRNCDIIFIEEQFCKKGRGKIQMQANVGAIKIAECTLTWFLSIYPFKKIMYFGSENKTNILGAPPKMTKTQRKKWATDKSREIYEMRKDSDMIELFKLKDAIFRKRLNSEKKIRSYLDLYPIDCSEDCRELSEKIVREKQKLDDIADACVQAQAFKFRQFIATF